VENFDSSSYASYISQANALNPASPNDRERARRLRGNWKAAVSASNSRPTQAERVAFDQAMTSFFDQANSHRTSTATSTGGGSSRVTAPGLSTEQARQRRADYLVAQIERLRFTHANLYDSLTRDYTRINELQADPSLNMARMQRNIMKQEEIGGRATVKADRLRDLDTTIADLERQLRSL
jgi:hypothetical protein